MFWIKSRRPKLEYQQQRRLDAVALPKPLGACELASERFVVVDLETTGLNTKKDLVISIGAVAIDQEAIDFRQMFECTLKRDTQVNESILIHGISPSELAAGIEPEVALLDFLEYVGNSPLLAFHACFDRHMLVRAFRESLGYRFNHPFFDVAEIAPLLNPQVILRHNGLDDWVKQFKLQVNQRHHASADALATAELALILFHQARCQGIENLAQLESRLNIWRRNNQYHPSL